MTKLIDLTFDQVSTMLAYDADTGRMTWRVDPCRRMKAGDEAGSLKGKRISKKTGKTTAYRYIRINEIETPAARVAWLLHHGAWPETNVLFGDGDPTNLRAGNLRLAPYPTIKSGAPGRRVYKMQPAEQRRHALRRYYGMTGEEYGEMTAAQMGVCAICHRPETAMLNGTPKVMHVDHDHATGQLRSLLCGKCNGMLGLAQDNPATLRAAADYLEHHAAQPRKVISGKFAVTDKGAA